MEATARMEATDADSTEKQEEKASHPMEKMELDRPGDGIMAITVGRVNLISSMTV
jgi:hypothetical protein